MSAVLQDLSGDKSGGQDNFVKNPIPLENGGMGGGDRQLDDFLGMARENFNVGKNYFDIAVRRRIEDNLAHAYSRHASGSKFYSPEYEKRSKIFRPKTRAMMRKLEAACALAFFSTRDVVDVGAVNEDDNDSVIAAEVHKELLNLRLTTTIPWFKVCLGAFHDAMSQGVVLSCQEWRYEEAEMVEDEYSGETPTGNSKNSSVVLHDTPWIRLVPVENLMFHPSSDWLDPVNSSPYLIEMQPWFAPELAQKISNANRYGSQVPYLKDWTEEELLAGMSEASTSAMSVRMAREHSRLDRYSQVQQGTKNRPVWVHRNIVRINGLDWVYETLGTSKMLSTPVPIEDVYGRRKRPYKMGSLSIEPHRLYTSGPVEMVKGLQEGINDVTNQRRDNVALALNNRWLVKRGQMVDSRMLMRNTPGSITMTTDPTSDVKQLETKDVTGSAYQEQDRFNVDFDEIAGQFTPGTMQAIKPGSGDMTVGASELLGNNADIVCELQLQTFCITWVREVLQDVAELETIFENDRRVLGLVSNRVKKSSNWMQAFRLLDEPVNISVSVGFGSTDPLKRLQKFQSGMQIINTLDPDLMKEMDDREVVHEVMGALGYRDGTRFFPGLADDVQQTPKEKQLTKQVADLQAQLQQLQSGERVAQVKADASIKIAQIKSEATKDVSVARLTAEKWKANLQGQIAMLDHIVKMETNTIKKAGMLLEREALSHSIMEADRAFALQVATTPAVPAQLQPNVPTPPGEGELATELMHPGSAQAVSEMESKKEGEPMNLPGPDMAGTIARGDFQALPGQRG